MQIMVLLVVLFNQKTNLVRASLQAYMNQFVFPQKHKNNFDCSDESFYIYELIKYFKQNPGTEPCKTIDE